MTKSRGSYSVVYERDGDGWWVASVRGVRGCHTQGRSIDQARNRIRDALSLFVDDAEAAELVDEIRLPDDVQRSVEEFLEADRQVEEAQETKRRAVLSLAGWASRRDAARILGMSHQRVQQYASGGGRKQGKRRRAA